MIELTCDQILTKTDETWHVGVIDVNPRHSKCLALLLAKNVSGFL
jgi:hypothetical protein